jgi:hypothetical protein
MKRGLVGIIILSILGVLLLGGIVGGYYAYNTHIYKTLRICLGEDTNSGFPCETTQQCIDLIETYSNESEKVREAINEAPDFLKSKFQEVLDKGVRCEKTCLIRDVRGIDKETGDFEFLESCNDGEEEIILEIRGKEALAILKFIKEQKRK